MSDNLVPITIDGHELSVPKGTLLVEAAREIGIEIPVYCYHPKMKPVGACRVCAVEVEGQRRPIMTACTTEVMPNMVVHTRSDNAIAAREGILEFLLINHPLDCPVCDRAGECDLQDFTLRYGPATTRFVEAKRHFAKSKQVGQNVILDRERCIMCQRCVRFCSEIAMEEGLVIVDRGNRSEIGTFEGRSFDSQYSGNTIELCPVGALTAKSYRFNARPWEQQHYAGLCNHCSVGCNITVDVRFDEVVRFRSRCNDEIDDGWLCDSGRYGHQHIHDDARLAQPLLRDASGALQPVSWEQALAKAAEKLQSDGAKASVLLGSQLSLEDGHAWLRLARGVLKTANLAHRHAGEGKRAGNVEARGRIVGCDDAEVIVCVGSHPHATHAGVDLRIKKGLRRGARLVSLHREPVMEGLADFQALGDPSQLWKQLLASLDGLGPAAEQGLKIPAPRPWEAGGATSTEWDALVETFRDKSKVMVIVAGTLAEQQLEELPKTVLERGWSTAPHGVLHLRSGANAVGLDLVGCQPDLGPGAAPLTEAKRYTAEWGEFASGQGKAYLDLAKSAGPLMLAVGCDPLAEPSASKPGFVIACATAPNATTEKADIVFPLSTWVESHGAFVSTDATLQLSRQAVLPVGESQPAWAIASALVKAVRGGEAPYKTTRQLFAEIGKLNPAFAGYSYRDFEASGEMHWSYPQQADLGMPRPDLSAIPVPQPDSPMWMPVANTGSRVERAARLTRGDQPPSVPGQDDPRRIAELLGLAYDPERYTQPALAAAAASVESNKTGYVPLRVMATSAAQPAGPTPAKRHQKLGVAPHMHPAAPTALLSLTTQQPETDDAESLAEEPSEVTETATAAEVNPPDRSEAESGEAKSGEAESAQSAETTEEVTGDSNVAKVDVVTEDGAAVETAAADPASSGSSEQEIETGRNDSSAQSHATKGENVSDSDSVPAPVEKAKKGKRKGSKEKKK